MPAGVALELRHVALRFAVLCLAVLRMSRFPNLLHPVAVLAACLCLAFAPEATAQDTSTNARADTATHRLAGSWLGTLSGRGADFRVVFHLKPGSDGLTGTMDSPDQGATGIPVSKVLVDGDTVRIGVRAIGGRFAGVVQPSADATVATTISGQWAQGPARVPLTLRRVDDPPGVDRPQEPTGTPPYDATQVQFTNDEAGITLAGTLTMPPGDGPHPAVVLIAGSGAQNRDAATAGHRPFLVWADALARRGIAVLRYDERGVGASEGSQSGATMRDLAADARAAVDDLRSRPNVDASRIGLVGHSEGGLIAAMVANDASAVDFVALLAAPGLPGDEVLAGQLDRRAQASGIDRRTRAAQRGTQQRIFDALKQETDSAAVAEELRKIMIDTRGIDGEEMIRSEIKRLTDPGLRFFLRYDPAEALRQLDEPVLAVIGSKDTHLDPKKNLDALREALGASSSPDVTVQQLDGLNHLLQPAKTGTPAEYGRIEQTVAPEALDLVVSWIARHAALDATR